MGVALVQKLPKNSCCEFITYYIRKQRVIKQFNRGRFPEAFLETRRVGQTVATGGAVSLYIFRRR